MKLISFLRRHPAVPCLLLAAAIFCFWQNNALCVTRLSFESVRLPAAFDGTVIVHLSDLHSKSFGKNQDRLVRRVRELCPDYIVFTGDAVDSRRYDIEPVTSLVSQLCGIAPTFFVTGNHELRSGRSGEVCRAVQQAGAVLLDNAGLFVERGGERIFLCGLADQGSLQEPDAQAALRQTLDGLSRQSEGAFSLLLSHRPELFALYVQACVDLSFCGHAHGGQWRLPLVGGLYAPGQGLFPQYTAGLYLEGGQAMAVSRGLGNSLFPLRLFNRPEVVALTLRAPAQAGPG